MNTKTSIHGQWSSKFTFIMAATGAAVGLGNIWKFPYMAGDNGGSAFVFVYLICVLLIGIPAMIAEVMLGRMGRKNPINTMYELGEKYNNRKAWQYVGWLGALTLLIVLSFYSVVAGWSLAYIFKSLLGSFNAIAPDQVLGIWVNFLQNPQALLLWHSIFMFMTLLVVAQGVKNGIERASKIMMPCLFLVLLILVCYAIATGDASQAFHFLFASRVHELNPQVIIAAMGHAFFTLAIGAGAMLVYGAYLKDETNIMGSIVIISLLDVMVAILAGLAIFPILFAYNIAPEEGPGLMFKVLPIAFAQMPAGQIIGCLFFILLLFTAWTSSISMAEPLVALLVERKQISRIKAASITGIFAWGLGIASLLSFNVWQQVKILGIWDIFTAITDLATNLLLPIGGLLFAIFVGWFIPAADAHAVLKPRHNWAFTMWRFTLKFVTPLGILIVFAGNIF